MSIVEVAPPQMPYHIETGRVDGVFAPEPFNQIPVSRGTGFIFMLSKEIWDGHPCCCFTCTEEFIHRNPRTYQAMRKSILEAELALHRATPEERRGIAAELCQPGVLDQPDSEPVAQALSGEYDDGLGRRRVDHGRVDFLPTPWPDFGTWILSQQQRWNQLRRQVDYGAIVGRCFDPGTQEAARAMGFEEPEPKLGGRKLVPGGEPYAYMRGQPFCAFQEQAETKVPPPESRLNRLCEVMAAASGGKWSVDFHVEANDAIGEVEQLFCDLLKNMRFTRDGLSEQNEMLRRSRERILKAAEEAAAANRAAAAAAEELKASKEQLDLALKSSRMGVWFWDAGTGRRAFDEQTCRLLGLDRAAFGGVLEEFLAAVHPDDHEAIRSALNRTLRDDAPYEVEYRAVWPDGSVHHVCSRGRLVRDDRGQPRGLNGIIWDITDRKLMEESLLESERKFKDLVEKSIVGVYLLQGGLFRYVNAGFAEVFGYSVEEMKDRLGPKDVVFPEDLPFVEESIRKRISGELKTVNYGFRGVTGGGDVRPVEVYSSSTTFRGRPAVIGTLMDVSERKRSEEALAEYAHEMERKNALLDAAVSEAKIASVAKSEFLANMSHEIRTPMNGIIGMAGLLLDTDLKSEQRHYAEVLRNSAESLLALLNDILDFSKIEAGKLELETLDFDLRAMLDDFAATLAFNAHRKGLELVCAVAPGVPPYYSGDPGRLRQILANLAGNAVKFTEKGEIVLRVGLVSETETAAELRFSVRDTGIGIPLDKRSLMFEKFSQADASTTRKYGGTGLGLAISKQLVHLMGGEIGFATEEGSGSEFWFAVRLAKRVGREREEFDLADIAGSHILVVDDNATNREVLVTQLAAWGVRPEEAPDGPAALKWIYSAMALGDPFQVVILDMQMPGMDGVAVARAIRSDPALGGLRLMMMSSLGQRGDIKRIEEVGFTAYLTKPARQAEIFQCLSVLLGLTDTSPQPKTIVTRHSIHEMRRGNFRILLAEDNIVNQQVAIEILKKMGLRIDPVANGEEAVKALESFPYDLVLMDVQMPVMDGVQATRLIRGPESAVLRHDIPIIAMTAHAMQGDRERFLDAGMNDYVSKPVSPQILADVLGRWLPKEPQARAEHPSLLGAAAASGHPAAPSARAAEEPEAPVFDRPALMNRLGHDAGLMRMVLDTFLDDIPRQIALLRDFLASGDARGAERQAHTIKGASANIGAERLRALAFEMEKTAKAGNLEGVLAGLDELDEQFGRLRETLQKEL